MYSNSVFVITNAAADEVDSVREEFLRTQANVRSNCVCSLSEQRNSETIWICGPPLPNILISNTENDGNDNNDGKIVLCIIEQLNINSAKCRNSDRLMMRMLNDMLLYY